MVSFRSRYFKTFFFALAFRPLVPIFIHLFPLFSSKLTMARYLHPRLADVYALCWAEEINRRRGREVVLHSSTAFYPVEQEGLNGMPLVPIPEDQIFGPEEAARKIRQWAPSGYLVDPGRVAQELELIP